MSIEDVKKHPLKAKELIEILRYFNPENYVFSIDEDDNLMHIIEVIEDEESYLYEGE